MFQTDPSTEGKPWFFVPDEVAPKLNALLDPNCPDEGFEIWLPTNMFRNTHFNFDVLQQQKQKKWVLMANENQTRTSRRTAVLQVADQKLRQRGFKLMATFRWQDSRGTFECYRLTGLESVTGLQCRLIQLNSTSFRFRFKFFKLQTETFETDALTL